MLIPPITIRRNFLFLRILHACTMALGFLAYELTFIHFHCWNFPVWLRVSIVLEQERNTITHLTVHGGGLAR
jgi:hypothetical protein